MSRRFIDISMPLENDVISDPVPFNPKITYVDHGMSVERMVSFSPGLEGESWVIEKVELITHNGTHLDALYHFASTMDRKLGADPQRAITIDEVPLDWCFRPGVKLDFRHLDDGHVVTAEEVEAEFARIGHDLQFFDIVVVNT